MLHLYRNGPVRISPEPSAVTDTSWTGSENFLYLENRRSFTTSKLFSCPVYLILIQSIREGRILEPQQGEHHDMFVCVSELLTAWRPLSFLIPSALSYRRDNVITALCVCGGGGGSSTLTSAASSSLHHMTLLQLIHRRHHRLLHPREPLPLCVCGYLKHHTHVTVHSCLSLQPNGFKN